MNKKIEELYKTIEAKDKIIDNQVLEISKLKNKIDKAIDFIKHNAIYSEFPMLPSDTLELLEILGDLENERT